MKNPGLTKRESEVFRHISAGYTTSQSAEKLGISEKPIHQLLEAAQELMDILRWMPVGPHHNAMIKLANAITKATEENSTTPTLIP